MSRKKTPYFGEEKWDKLTELLPKYVYIIHEDFKKIRREMYEKSSKEFESKASSRLTYEECEQAVIHPNTQRSHMPRIVGRKMGREEEVARRKKISDLLKYY